MSLLMNDHYGTTIKFGDNADKDAFSRVRVSDTKSLFAAQLTYGLQPLLYEQITAETGASIAHDATNRCATMTFSSTPTGGKAYMQTYDYFVYEPARSQLVFVTFNFIEAVAGVTKFAGYSDGSNGVEFQLSGTTLQFKLYSDTSVGDQTVTQSSWNLDRMDGTGTSSINLDITKVQILVLDMQALYIGRVRVGFDIDGHIYYAHEFLHANIVATPYIQSASLPVRCGMTTTATVSTTMRLICSAVLSEGGSTRADLYTFSAEAAVTAASGARTHLGSIRPKTTFNSIANRIRFVPLEFNLLVTGANPVLWEVVVGQALTTPSYADANTTYSAFEYTTAGTLSGNPAIVVESGYVPATNQVKGAFPSEVRSRYPITLNAAGAARDLGTFTVLVTGIGGTSACRGSLVWGEDR